MSNLGIWGMSERSKKTHYYLDGKTLCNRASHLDVIFPEWDETHVLTCETCKRNKELLSLGAVFTHHTAYTDNAELTNTA